MATTTTKKDDGATTTKKTDTTKKSTAGPSSTKKTETVKTETERSSIVASTSSITRSTTSIPTSTSISTSTSGIFTSSTTAVTETTHSRASITTSSTTSSATSQLQSDAAAATARSSPSAQPVQSTVAAPHNSLSKGAIAGIAVGSIAAVALIASGILFFIWWQMRRSRQEHQASRQRMDAEGQKDLIREKAAAFVAASISSSSSTADLTTKRGGGDEIAERLRPQSWSTNASKRKSTMTILQPELPKVNEKRNSAWSVVRPNSSHSSLHSLPQIVTPGHPAGSAPPVPMLSTHLQHQQHEQQQEQEQQQQQDERSIVSPMSTTTANTTIRASSPTDGRREVSPESPLDPTVTIPRLSQIGLAKSPELPSKPFEKKDGSLSPQELFTAAAARNMNVTRSNSVSRLKVVHATEEIRTEHPPLISPMSPAFGNQAIVADRQRAESPVIPLNAAADPQEKRTSGGSQTTLKEASGAEEEAKAGKSEDEKPAVP